MSTESPIEETKPKSRVKTTEKETGRLEAFSDGVFAVAITLLILDVKVPPLDLLPKGQVLSQALIKQWPAYLAYFTSFLTILVMWINHHNLFKQIKLVDHTFLLINGFLLMVVTIIPFPTSVVVEYILEPDDQLMATVLYSGTSVFLALSFFTLWLYASSNNRLLDKEADREAVRNITNQYRLGPLFYLVAFVLAFINAWLSITVCLLLALFFALPSTIFSSLKRVNKSQKIE